MNFKFKISDFSLDNTLNSGQCFRFYKIKKDKFLVFAGLHSSYIIQKKEYLYFEESDCCEKFWKRYFNLDVDYKFLYKNFIGDKVLEKLLKKCYGMRILKQDIFECLISFILSINNNIKRIQKIIEILCENFGVRNKNGFSFPCVDVLCQFNEKDFEILRAGFRVKYLLDAIYKVKNGEISLENICCLDFKEAKMQLKKIKGVGEKVANCVLLFAYNRMESFPIDVWIKRVVEEYYKNGLTEQVLSCPGLAQQFLFFGKRNKYI